MIVKKKSEEAERKRAYTKRVLELLYPEEHASSTLSTDQREGSSTPSESLGEATSNGEMCVSAVEPMDKVQLKPKIYGVSIPPAGLKLSSCQGDLLDQAAVDEHSSSEEQEPFNDDLSLTKRRRRRKRQRPSQNQSTKSFTAVHPCSTASQSMAKETAESTESMSKNRRRKLKKKLKCAERMHAPSAEFVYRDIHETSTENVSSETHDAGKP